MRQFAIVSKIYFAHEVFGTVVSINMLILLYDIYCGNDFWGWICIWSFNIVPLFALDVYDIVCVFICKSILALFW